MKIHRVSGGSVTIDGTSIPVDVWVNPRARRLILRLSREGRVRVTCPSRRHIREALDMVRTRRAWLADRLSETPTPIPLHNGAAVPVLGVDRTIECGIGPAGMTSDKVITATDDVEKSARTAVKLLRRAARDHADEVASSLAASIDVTVSDVTVRQMRSRWGSCSVDGKLSFNWRLIFAPLPVFRYVIAHEVAHRRYMDHSPAFWRTVEMIDPDYQSACTWLRERGQILHAYGQTTSSE